jgi:asparagine synthase (glutamine-hydrolysing)
MGNSVEGRYPFLDHRIIEFCASLPEDFKLKGLTEKFLLKEVVKGKIPNNIINRSKQAYRAPISSAFLSKNAPDYVKNILHEKNIRETGIFNSKSVTPLLDKMRKSDSTSEVEDMLLTLLVSSHLVNEQINLFSSKPLKQEELLNSRIITE